MKLRLDPVTRTRIKRFVSSRRAFVSLILITVLYVISLFSNLIANNKPLIIVANGKTYFPIVFFYPEAEFRGTFQTAPNYKRLADEGVFDDAFVVFPPIRYGMNESDLSVIPPAPPSMKHILGTDDRGRDLFTRLLYGFRVSMTFALILVAITTVIAIIIGAVQGYFAGLVDITFQRVIEILAALPGLYVVIIISTSLGRSFGVLILSLTLFAWMGLSYYMRAEFLRLRKQDFVEAARAVGQNNIAIMFRHILPNAITPLVTLVPFELVAAIYALSSLDFLGLGLQAPTPSWGELMRQALDNLDSYWLAIFPFLALFITLLLITFVGEGIREAANPREYARME